MLPGNVEGDNEEDEESKVIGRTFSVEEEGRGGSRNDRGISRESI